jgi:hypothetical protein
MAEKNAKANNEPPIDPSSENMLAPEISARNATSTDKNG